uniref:Palmitoyltransferase n=1 Tax=Ciona savignyi TaxID=51511 RepID=H2YGI9_CIOSA
MYNNAQDLFWKRIGLIYVFINIAGNYILGITNKSFFYNGLLLTDPPKSWHFCNTCDQYCPPRTHHCDLCKSCILKQDHHCFFFAQCVGLRNQRYFIPYTMYVALGSLHAMYVLLIYADMVYVPLSWSFYAVISYTIPGILYNWMYDYGDVSFATVSCITLSYLTFSAGFGSLFLFISQCVLLVRGQTPHEYYKNIHTFNHGIKNNITQQFGRWWFVYFIIPLPRKMENEKKLPWGAPQYFKSV